MVNQSSSVVLTCLGSVTVPSTSNRQIVEFLRSSIAATPYRGGNEKKKNNLKPLDKPLLARTRQYLLSPEYVSATYGFAHHPLARHSTNPDPP